MCYFLLTTRPSGPKEIIYKGKTDLKRPKETLLPPRP
jgi:hypothetical protein